MIFHFLLKTHAQFSKSDHENCDLHQILDRDLDLDLNRHAKILEKLIIMLIAAKIAKKISVLRSRSSCDLLTNDDRRSQSRSRRKISIAIDDQKVANYSCLDFFDNVLFTSYLDNFNNADSIV